LNIHTGTLSAESQSVTPIQLPAVVAIDFYRPKRVGVEFPIIRNNTLPTHEAIALQRYFCTASDFCKRFVRNGE
jgi:hypothetical protein